MGDSARSAPQPVDVLIVGGGLTGLLAARELCAHGWGLWRVFSRATAGVTAGRCVAWMKNFSCCMKIPCSSWRGTLLVAPIWKVQPSQDGRRPTG